MPETTDAAAQLLASSISSSLAHHPSGPASEASPRAPADPTGQTMVVAMGASGYTSEYCFSNQQEFVKGVAAKRTTTPGVMLYGSDAVLKLTDGEVDLAAFNKLVDNLKNLETGHNMLAALRMISAGSNPPSVVVVMADDKMFLGCKEAYYAEFDKLVTHGHKVIVVQLCGEEPNYAGFLPDSVFSIFHKTAPPAVKAALALASPLYPVKMTPRVPEAEAPLGSMYDLGIVMGAFSANRVANFAAMKSFVAKVAQLANIFYQGDVLPGIITYGRRTFLKNKIGSIADQSALDSSLAGLTLPTEATTCSTPCRSPDSCSSINRRVPGKVRGRRCGFWSTDP
jgi:hypothetical protein